MIYTKTWADIAGYEGYYKVSNDGEVKSVRRVVKRGSNYKPVEERLLKLGNNHGYRTVALSKNGKVFYYQVHRLVAVAFIPNPNNLSCVNHKDENPANNCVNNLEWCTKSYNNSYNKARIKAAISKRKVVLQFNKDGKFIREWSYAKEAADALNLNKRAIYECCKGRCKTSGGYIWKRKEDIQQNL